MFSAYADRNLNYHDARAKNFAGLADLANSEPEPFA